MRIKKEMLSEDLQPYYGPMMAYARVLGKPWGIRLMLLIARLSRGRDVDGLACEQRTIPSRSGGRDIRLRIYRPLGIDGPLPGLLYLHGGGYMISTPEDYGAAYSRLIEAAPSVIVAPDYRKSFEAPYPAALDDCYDTLLWMRDHADELGVIPDRFAVAGHSAGGGLTAAVTLKATDSGDVRIAFQAPIYPMIDDKQTTFSSQFEAPVWGAASNRLGWESYLRGLRESRLAVPAYAAPARTTDYSKLPPTISYVGSVDPFRDEVQTYVDNLRSAGVPVAFELFKGAFHGFEITAPESGVGQAAWAFMMAQYREYVGRYF